MAEREYDVVYKSRTVPRNSSGPDQERRRRLPTALDPYDYPYDAEPVRRSKSRNDRDSISAIETNSTQTLQARTTKSSYPAKSRNNEVSTDIQRSKREGPSRTSNDVVEDYSRRSKNAMNIDQREYEASPLRRLRDFDEPRRPERSRDALDFEVERPRSQKRLNDYSIDNSVRREGGTYIIDTRAGEVTDVRTSGGNTTPRYVYIGNGSHPQQKYDERDYREREEIADGVFVLRRNVSPPAQSRSRYRDDPPARDYDKDDDWRIVESMRTTKLDTSRSREQDGNHRSRAPTQSSEDSFVMVSPTQAETRPSVRSALRRSGYSPAETSRRRSRSISFRETEVAFHDVSERRHERPGAEAEICGAYLRSRSRDGYDASDFSRPPQKQSDLMRFDRRSDARQDSAREDFKEPYAPQQSYDSSRRKRSRSRRRRRDSRDEDDRSYYSEHKTYIKEKRYS